MEQAAVKICLIAFLATPLIGALLAERHASPLITVHDYKQGFWIALTKPICYNNTNGAVLLMGIVNFLSFYPSAIGQRSVPLATEAQRQGTKKPAGSGLCVYGCVLLFF